MNRSVFSVVLVICLAVASGFFVHQFFGRVPQGTFSGAKQAATILSQKVQTPTTTSGVLSQHADAYNQQASFDATSTTDAVTLALAKSSSSLPTQFLLHVPFSTQAPLVVWDALHEETCEETAVMLVAAFYHGEQGTILPKTADARILRIVGIERKLLGTYRDTSAADTAIFAKQSYPNLQATVVSLQRIDDIKQWIAKGVPVIVPADGKALQNPHFKNGGPKYHMLVVIGYANGSFITNDPGTHAGASYVYPEQRLFNAIHDWNNGDVKNGKKVALILQTK